MEVADISRIQISTASHGRKRLCSMLGGVVHKSIVGNIPTLPHTFEVSSPAEQYGTSYEHRAGRNTPDLRIGRRKCTNRKSIAKGAQRDAPDRQMSQFV
ncbi:hypothetical protein TNCV_1849171 [Trichonephila clavipes]|nr:hypothetical protein TNCV_1849171 [Trichonephila clavipes]